MNAHFQYILKQIELNPKLVFNIYPYGSEVYGTLKPQSDRDYIMVLKQEEPEIQLEKIGLLSQKVKQLGTYNVTCYSPTKFQEILTEHNPAALECYYLPKTDKYESYLFDFHLNIEKLRRSFATVSSNSWVKCKKKMEQGDDYLGKKSLFHALRILDFGIQIAENKQINFRKPYALSNSTFENLWQEIDKNNTWMELKIQFQPHFPILLQKYHFIII